MKYLTVRDIAERMQVSEYTVCVWLKSGKLRGAKVGGFRWRISEDALDEYVKKCEVPVS